MEHKLAALFAILGTMILIGTWCMRYGAGLGVMEPVRLLLYALCCLVGYFVFGIVVARISIGLVDEILSDMRSREERRRTLASGHLGGLAGVGVDSEEAPAVESREPATGKNEKSARAEPAGKKAAAKT